MEIRKITRYKLGGKEFNSIGLVKTHVENKLGALIDYKMCVSLNTKQKLSIMGALVSNREEFVKWLSITLDTDPDNFQDVGTVNILDY